MSDILMELTERRRMDAVARERELPFETLIRRAETAPAPRDFAAAINQPTPNAPTAPRVIAELKRASPSEGMIREIFHPVALARELASSGAAALSVLCEPHRFLGSETFLTAVREEVEIPILYKDFLSTRYQIAAARAAGADAVLLIAAVLDDTSLKDLLAFTHRLGMAALVETHDEREIGRAVQAEARIIGVNCRNLRDFSTDVSLLETLMEQIPRPSLRVAESGMHTGDALRRAGRAGADAFLVGTALMRAEYPGEKLNQLRSAASGTDR